MTERRSTRHGPRVDDELAQETQSLTTGAPVEARSEESRTQEAEADDEPVPDSRVAGERFPPTAGGLPGPEVEERSQLAASLRPGAFPATAAELATVAEQEHAPPSLLAELRRLPSGARFANVQEVWEALGGHGERRGPR